MYAREAIAGGEIRRIGEDMLRDWSEGEGEREEREKDCYMRQHCCCH